MSDEKKELALVTLPAEKVDLEVALLNDKFIDELIDNVRKTAGSVVGDLKTTKGRGVYITMADQVRKSKTAFEVRAKELVAELKARPALIDANRKKFRDEMDKIAVVIRKPVTDWEAEQERLAAEAAYAAMWQEAHEMDASITAERLVKKESDHEMALLMNDAFDRDAKAKADEVERLRKAHEEFIAQQAAEKAKREVEEKAKRDIEAAEQRERDAKLAQERAEQAIKDNAAKAERDAKELAERVEREKQDAIAAEKLKAQQESERVQREAKQKEDARLAEEKRVADEAAKKAADKAHQAEVNNAAIAVLTNAGIDTECAKACVIAIIKNQVAQSFLNQRSPIQINY
ncbi:cell envelope biogenesis protein TolA [Yersinia enterocolitica]|nr:cell envelope biogenesis protein TolA [Yersinia enterocolitica]